MCAKVVFHVVDRDGNEVNIETGEIKFEDACTNYPSFLKIVTDAGFTPIKHNGSNGNGKKAEAKQIIDGKTCPKCGKGVWNNTTVKKEDAAKAKWPDYSCKEKCGWAVWPGQYTIT